MYKYIEEVKMKIKIILLFFTLLYSSVSMSGAINKTPNHESFNNMFQYWITEGVVLKSILNTSVTKVLTVKDPSFVMSALFILSKSGKTEIIKKDAIEALSSYCYNYSKEENDVNFSKCVDGTLLTSVSKMINNYYVYKASKKHWENVAYNCINYNYSNPSSSNRSYNQGNLTDECALQLSTEAYSNQSLVVENNTTKINTGVPLGYEEKNKLIYTRDYIATTPYRSLYNRDLNRIYGNCPSGYAEIDANHYRLYKNGSGSKKHAKTAYCLKNPYANVYPAIASACQATSKLIKSVSSSKYESLCKNWVDSGLNSSSVFFRAMKASVIPNQSIALDAALYGYDSAHQQKRADLKTYWSGNSSVSNVDALSYKSMTVYGGGRSFSGRGFSKPHYINGSPYAMFGPTEGYYINSAADLYLNNAPLGKVGNKVEFYVDRSGFPGGMFTSIIKYYPTAQSKFGNMNYNYNYPLLNIDTIKSTALYNGYNKVYNLNNKIVSWLNNEDEWINANSYSCGSVNMNVYSNNDILYSDYMYTQKDAVAANESDPRAVKIKVDYGTKGLKAFSKKITKSYNKCIAN
jgi:hypothetical protein